LVKRNVRLFAAENNKCTNAAEFVACADSHGGIKSVTLAHCQLQVQNVQKPKIPGITNYNNFEFLENGDIHVWRAYKVGIGKKLRKTWPDESFIPTLTVVSYHTEGMLHTAPFGYRMDSASTKYWKDTEKQPDPAPTNPSNQQPQCRDEKDDNDQGEGSIRLIPESTSQLFACPEPACTKVYQKKAYLDYHIEFGKHHYSPQHISLKDRAIRMYKQELEGPHLPPNTLPVIQEALNDLAARRSSAPLEMGWALRTRRAHGAFDPDVRVYLTTKFNEGEVTGRKLDPRVVAKSMRLDFPPEKWLRWGQIASFWSRLARQKRQEGLDDMVIDDEDENNQANVAYESDLTHDPYFNNSRNGFV